MWGHTCNVDFGNGWQLDIGNPKENVEYAPGTTTGLGTIPMLENSRVSITLNDGNQQNYKFRPIPGQFNSFGLNFQTFYEPYFQRDTGANGWLEGSGPGRDAKLLRIENGNGNHEYVDMYTGQSYNPTSGLFGRSFDLTTREGTKYNLDTDNENAKLFDRNKNWVQFTDSGITSSTGREVKFVRACGTASASVCPITQVIAPDDTPADTNDNPRRVSRATSFSRCGTGGSSTA